MAVTLKLSMLLAVRLGTMPTPLKSLKTGRPAKAAGPVLDARQRDLAHCAKGLTGRLTFLPRK
jgi:hypothetical protein